MNGMNARTLVVGVALLAAIPAVARADRPPQDTVTVTDGSVWRGTITEQVAGDHVTVTLPDGQQARIRWDAIARIDRASAPATGLAPSPAPGPMVRVHIEADTTVTLEHVRPRGTPGGRYELVCVSPCDRDVPMNDSYRVSGPGVRGSAAFSLAGGPPGQPVSLEVETTSTGGFVGGIVLTSLGGAAVLVGSMLLLVGASTSNVTRSESRGFVTAGAITGVAGLAMLVPGMVLMLGNGSSKVERTRPAAVPPPVAPEPRAPAPGEGLPITWAVPLVQGAF